ncbi:MAG: hypothetical protein IPN85_13230 [Flavobacteriales bacterium]|nr:hypothetical protein [Flavobacteriales bacterium]
MKWLVALGVAAPMGPLTFLTGRALVGQRLDRIIILGYLLIAGRGAPVAPQRPLAARSRPVRLLPAAQCPMPLVFLVIASFLPGRDVSRH